MNLKKIEAEARRQGYVVEIDKSGIQYTFTIRDANNEINPIIKTDRHGLELFVLDGFDRYLHYCESAGVEPF